MVVDIKEVIEKKLREGETFEKINDQLLELAYQQMLKHFEGEDGLKQRLLKVGLPDYMECEEFAELYSSHQLSYPIMKLVGDMKYDHKIGYYGEIAVHSLLRRDWHDVFKYNDPKEKHNPCDGEVSSRFLSLSPEPPDFLQDEEAVIEEYEEPEAEEDGLVLEGKHLKFDVKAHHKDFCGLSLKPSPYSVNCDLYIVCHWIGRARIGVNDWLSGKMHIIGYATRDAILARPPIKNKYGKMVLTMPPKVPPLRPFGEFLRFYE